MILKTIQYISAKNKLLHQFLKEQGLNNYSHIFFLDYDENYYMLAIPGIVYKFIPCGQTFYRVVVADKAILAYLLSLAKEAIEKNQECLRETYNAILHGLEVQKIMNC